MVSYPLPNNTNKDIKSILMDKYRIETPIFTWKNRLFIRISIQIYNDKNDVDYLMKALKTICYI
jgi:isopenicillin-N epimerase